MQRQRTQRDVEASPAASGDARRGRTLSRRQALGRMSAVAGAGAAAWVVPEILTAKPAAGAALSTNHGTGGGGTSGTTNSPGVTTTPSQTSGSPVTEASTTPLATTAAPAATTPAKTLAFTGLNIQRDAEIGAALIAGGWAMHHWASRTPKVAAEGSGAVDEAGSADTPT